MKFEKFPIRMNGKNVAEKADYFVLAAFTLLSGQPFCLDVNDRM